MTTQTIRKAAAEFLGTFALVFAGTGAIVINDVSNGAVTHAGIAINRFSEFRLGYQFNWYKANQRIGLPIPQLTTLGFRRDALAMRYAYEGQDDAIVARRGPLRVRAFVCVRWPRTGSPRRCRNPR